MQYVTVIHRVKFWLYCHKQNLWRQYMQKAAACPMKECARMASAPTKAQTTGVLPVWIKYEVWPLMGIIVIAML